MAQEDEQRTVELPEEPTVEFPPGGGGISHRPIRFSVVASSSTQGRGVESRDTAVRRHSVPA